MCDKQIEELYKELEDVIFDEDEELGMVLADDWKEWKKGTERLTIWEWFDSHHSKGLGWLYENVE